MKDEARRWDWLKLRRRKRITSFSRPRIVASVAAVDRFYRNVLLPPVRYVTRDDAEVAHEWLVKTLTFLQKHPNLLNTVLPHSTIRDHRLEQTLLGGLQFPNPFGTAAGFDKAASIFPALQRLTGAGFVELGGVTPKPQPGNDRPRIVRADKDHLINAMGFPNAGIDAVVENILARPQPVVPLGLQIVKQKVTPNEDAAAEYGDMVRATAKLYDERMLPDFIVVNVSSPNTPGLRAMQDPRPLAEVLDATTQALDEQERNRKQTLIKLAPELEHADIEMIVELVERFDIGGIILTNTTTTRPVESVHNSRAGGFSGSALYPISSKLVKFAASVLPDDRVLVATGGIDSVERAYEMLHYADLIGGYTGLVLQGPNLFRRLAAGVLAKMESDGVSTLADLRSQHRGHKSGQESADTNTVGPSHQ